MAKASAKPVTGKAKLKKAPAQPKVSAADIGKASEQALAMLKVLNIEHQLQADIEWCLGSYRADNNPIGLFDVVAVSLTVFKDEKKKKTKGVTAKLIADLEKALRTK